MESSSYLASFYLACGVITFFLAGTILRHSMRSVVNWSTALVLLFAGVGPLLGAVGFLLERNLKVGTVLFGNFVNSFDYIWEFFFPSLVFFALVHPRAGKLWKYTNKFMFLLFVPHLFHLILVIFLMDRVEPADMLEPLTNFSAQTGIMASLLSSAGNSLRVFIELLFKAHSKLFSMVNISYAACSLVLLGNSLKLDLAPRVRRQMMVVLAGLSFCILTYSVARVVPIFSGMDISLDTSAILINASLIIGGGSIAFAIVRYRFLDLRFLARKGILYVAAIFVFASVYLLIVKQIASTFQQFSEIEVETLETGFIILFIIIAQPVLSRAEVWIDRLIVREESKPRVRVQRLSNELISIVELESLNDHLREKLSETFGASDVDVMMVDQIKYGGLGDTYSGKVVELLSRIREPIGRVDFLKVMGFVKGRGHFLGSRRKKMMEEISNSLTGIVGKLAGYELIVPVFKEDNLEAVILLGTRREQRGYSTEEQALLAMLASQVSASLDRIDLLSEVVEKKVMEEELELAREIQLELLPSSPPTIDRYETVALSFSSKQVGGDYYDYMCDDSHLAFTVADVAGKGVPASLLMASLQASLRSMVDYKDDTTAVIGRLNNVMFETTSTEKFATMFYGCLNIKKDELRFTNAGHNFPVIIRERGDIHILDYSGLILGIQPGFEYKEHVVKMERGDILVITTDGVNEAINPDGEMFGEERLYKLLRGLREKSAEGVRDAITESVREFSGPESIRDDLTIMVLKRIE